MKKLIHPLLIAIAFFFIAGDIGAQVLEAPTQKQLRAWEKGMKDDNKETGNVVNREAIAYVHVREADVMWAKRVWRTIDLREKINHPLYYPEVPVRHRKSLTQTLWDAITVEQVMTVFNDEDFTMPLTPEEILAASSRSDTDWVPKITNYDEDSMVIYTEEFNAADVKQYRILEDWFFDRERSVMDVRIIGIAPLVDEYIDDPFTGEREFKGQRSLFWIYFPDARPILANHESFNRFNDAERRSFDDIFWKRQFSSVIIKQENVYDRFIQDYLKGIDALLKAEAIKNEIRNYEHDMWEF